MSERTSHQFIRTHHYILLSHGYIPILHAHETTDRIIGIAFIYITIFRSQAVRYYLEDCVTCERHAARMREEESLLVLPLIEI